MIIGNLGQDPDGSYTPSGTANSKFSVATTETRKNKDGQKESETTWHNCIAWGNLAEICNQYLKKGSKVFIEGRLSKRTYQDKNGNDRLAVEVVVNNMEMLSPKQESSQKTVMPNDDELEEHPF